MVLKSFPGVILNQQDEETPPREKQARKGFPLSTTGGRKARVSGTPPTASLPPAGPGRQKTRGSSAPERQPRPLPPSPSSLDPGPAGPPRSHGYQRAHFRHLNLRTRHAGRALMHPGLGARGRGGPPCGTGKPNLGRRQRRERSPSPFPLRGAARPLGPGAQQSRG